MRLTHRQENFARNIVAGMSYTQAAINAGYSEKTARNTGSQNMTKQHILDYIDEMQAEREALLQRQFMHEAHMAFNELRNVLYDEDTPPHVKANTAKTIIDYAGFAPTEKHDIETNGGLDIKVSWADDDED